MTIIDLSIPLYSGMPVFPGDPEVSIELIQTFEKDAWNMRRIEMNGHDGTHINAQVHGMATGKNLDDYELSDFAGEAVVFETKEDVKEGIGVLFKTNIDQELAEFVASKKPKFVGFSAEEDLNIDIEKYFFTQDILVYERLANLNILPKKFMFYGMPLKIKEGDGSPVRAFAVTN